VDGETKLQGKTWFPGVKKRQSKGEIPAIIVPKGAGRKEKSQTDIHKENVARMVPYHLRKEKSQKKREDLSTRRRTKC